MKAERMGKELVVTKEMYKKMGERAKSCKVDSRCKMFPYGSEKIDPKNHVRFSQSMKNK